MSTSLGPLGTELCQEVAVSSRLKSTCRHSFPSSVLLILQDSDYTLLYGIWKELEGGRRNKNPEMARWIKKNNSCARSHMPVPPLRMLRQEDQLSPRVQVQPGQHCETPISQKISPVKRKTSQQN
jgi:hypothetical protein